ncbi:aminoacyl-tRNA hydrolase [Aerococcaceae bacterium NML160702]|nr:aminoacyl-tRNA hydrolase [Aerococcaceae bacterium NML190073]MCW6665558.1 aminoacyl-tRNA hydrolase [Aerococcaceae bacterium NML191219]MCW6676943.1 aminoacyl-tRNA hydrolase [Aerococcaceae bacterium NML180378]MCW6680931.1 aminoacyl-tRNA hydrolase [Aerococcaceae bacterium NML130460]MCW6682718.1 aminoacyl-tRNA hydrolase [Aerococcaceae bacterium NML160702]MDO4774983.1 aminoacyl-tRNA hydrolase [Aerococcaceae bacterium]
MKLVVGLGNPGQRYEKTRHNVGFDVIDQLLDKHQLKMTDQKFRADYTVAHINGQKCLLVKPFTYMNLSGEALLPLMSYYGIAMDEILVIYDDMDLEPGRIRLRQNGGSGGHNGIKSIIEMLGDSTFNRVKVGVGRPQGGWKVVDHVLAPFSVDERITVENAMDEAVKAIEDWLAGQTFLEVMNTYNRKK